MRHINVRTSIVTFYVTTRPKSGTPLSPYLEMGHPKQEKLLTTGRSANTETLDAVIAISLSCPGARAGTSGARCQTLARQSTPSPEPATRLRSSLTHAE